MIRETESDWGRNARSLLAIPEDSLPFETIKATTLNIALDAKTAHTISK